MKEISGGVCAPLGFTASGIHSGIRKNKERLDLALIYCERECNAAAVFTTNRVKAAPVYLDMKNIKSGKMQAV
ncbi:MAG: bifunctional ornithine acetyltransferase/N-acetylglutamate synthase, partial [Clostridia bacterium]|nr:bifunctional ornithine acetyltransferase/N-acetylglutamate synthase [Clostridia bacterium]